MGESGEGADFLQLRSASAPAKGLTGWLVEAVRTAIADGRLKDGMRLPATRLLAGDLGISRGVVIEAYRRLAEEGLITARVGAGTVVSALPAPAPRPAPTERRLRPATGVPRLPLPPADALVDTDLSPGVPDLSAFPRAAWLRAEREVLGRATAADLAYGDPRGSRELRQELAGWLGRTRGVRADVDDIIIVNGVAQALALLAQTLRLSGISEIAVEDPGSRGAREGLAHWGLRPVPVPVDEEGMRVTELARTGLRAALLTPAHQFPTGVVLAPRRRRELMEWAGNGALVIEDDYDAEHRYDRAPVPALQASAPEHVAHAGSISKTLAPGMRLGWLIAPRSMQEELIDAKHASDLGCPALPQLVLAHLTAKGDLDRHIRLTRSRYRARRDVFLTSLRRALPTIDVQGVAAGLHLLITFPDLNGAVEDTVLADRVRRAGVLTHPLSWHRVCPGPPGLVVGYASHPAGRLRDAADRIAATVRQVLSADPAVADGASTQAKGPH
ncbi:PLP-dependent aminotransferase family protein [Streptomyces sp. NPDC093600]|uniref:MocR-like pyridoxine biosynthesis transcription factor PdxR n=1 Tax=Streptomyces sp. NPDC093600 TaxID=3366047 RepID=UPI003816EBD1